MRILGLTLVCDECLSFDWLTEFEKLAIAP